MKPLLSLSSKTMAMIINKIASKKIKPNISCAVIVSVNLNMLGLFMFLLIIMVFNLVLFHGAKYYFIIKRCSVLLQCFPGSIGSIFMIFIILQISIILVILNFYLELRPLKGKWIVNSKVQKELLCSFWDSWSLLVKFWNLNLNLAVCSVTQRKVPIPVFQNGDHYETKQLSIYEGPGEKVTTESVIIDVTGSRAIYPRYSCTVKQINGYLAKQAFGEYQQVGQHAVIVEQAVGKSSTFANKFHIHNQKYMEWIKPQIIGHPAVPTPSLNEQLSCLVSEEFSKITASNQGLIGQNIVTAITSETRPELTNLSGSSVNRQLRSLIIDVLSDMVKP